MKKILQVLPLLLVVLLLAGYDASAQQGRKAKQAEMRAKSREISKFTVKSKFSRNKQYASVGAFFGASNYFGDLAPRNNRISTSLAMTRTFFGGFYQKRLNANISVRGHLAWARLRGDDAEAPSAKSIEEEARYVRNLSFRNDVIEFGACGIIDILPTDRGYLRRNFLNGYGLLGLSVFYNNPKGLVPTGFGLPNEGKWVALQPLGTEGQGTEGYAKKYSRIQPAIMAGGGARYRVNDRLDIGIEISWRFTFTDYLDDVGGSYMKDKDAIAAGKDATWYALSNKSAQRYTSRGETRTGYKADGINIGGRSYNFETIPGSADQGTPIPRVKGYAVFDDKRNITAPNGAVIGQEDYVNTGSPRSNNDKDGFTVTTLTATYILEYKARVPKFR